MARTALERLLQPLLRSSESAAAAGTPACRQSGGEPESHACLDQGTRTGKCQLNEVLNAAPIAVAALDSNHCIRLFNRRAAAVFGYDAEEVLGLPVDRLVPARSKDSIAQLLEALVQTAPSSDSASASGGFVGLRKDGIEFPALASIVRFGSGPAATFTVMLNDMTERKQAEEALVAARERFLYLLSSSPSVIYSFDASEDSKPTFISANVRELLGYEPSEYLSDPSFWVNRVHPDDIDALMAEFPALYEKDRLTYRYRFRRKDGSYCWVNDSLQLIRDRSGEPVEIVGSWSDISERMKAEEENTKLELELRQAQKLEALGRLSSGIAHEINTPMQYVGDNVRFLEDAFAQLNPALRAHKAHMAGAAAGSGAVEHSSEQPGEIEAAELDYLIEEIPAAICQCLEGIARVNDIVCATKEFSHPDAQEKSAVNINQAIAATVTVCRHEWKYVAEVELDLDEALPLVPCLPGELNQVLLNLIVNAVDAIREKGEKTKGRIRIATHGCADAAEIRVSDTGVGIPPEECSKIFEPFYTTKEVGQGTGQGLAISHIIITRKHGGTIVVESEVGKGTTFIIRLPLLVDG